MARSTVAILKTSPATVLGDYYAAMTLAVLLALLARDRDTLSAIMARGNVPRPLFFVPLPFEWFLTMVLASYFLVASVLSQHSHWFSRPVARRMAHVPDCRWTGVMDAPKFAGRRRRPLPASA